ncbi:MAG: hypothetical protein R3C41_22665 [Calditrichia bacterium]|nr:hypothetical protein [Calditrichota bacterium]
MAETIDEITIDWEEDNILKVKELDKVVLTKGAWSTILFRYQQWDDAKEHYSADMYTIRRYRKSQGVYRQQSKFNISNAAQAQKIVEALTQWIENPQE